MAQKDRDTEYHSSLITWWSSLTVPNKKLSNQVSQLALGVMAVLDRSSY